MENEEVSKEEKERLLNEKMEAIRRRNEELQKRHEEIQVDKKLADEHSASAHINEVKPYVMKPPRPRPEKIIADSSDQNTSSEEPLPNQELLCKQRLPKDEGPPPDPSYRFLADPDRDGLKDAEKDGSEPSKGGEAKGRGRGRGGVNFEDGGSYGRRGRGRGRGRWSGRNWKNSGSVHRDDEGLENAPKGRKEYDQWKAERDAIDEERLMRARSRGGEWRREWDVEKREQQNQDSYENTEYNVSFPPFKEPSNHESNWRDIRRRKKVYLILINAWVWWLAVTQVSAQYQDMACETLGNRQGRKIIEPGPECDMKDRNWCSVRTTNYPEEKILDILLDNRGVMKRLFGDHREARMLEDAFENHVDTVSRRPPPIHRKKQLKKIPSDEFQNGKFPDTEILSNLRNGKKIRDRISGEAKVITIRAYPEEPKGSHLNKSQTNTYLLFPMRPNDKVYSKTFNIPFKRLTTTTATTEKTDSDDDLTTTEPTVFTEETTLSEDVVTLDLDHTVEELNATSKEFSDDAPIVSSAKNLTKDIMNKTASLESTTEHLNNSTAQMTMTVPPIPIDSQDELRYTTKVGNESNEETAPEEVEMKSKLKSEPKPSVEALEGRVEFQRYPPVSEDSFTSQSHSSSPTRPQLEKPPPIPAIPAIPASQSLNGPRRPSSDRPNSIGSPPNHIEKFPACNSTSEMIAPTWAKNIKGKNLIVVNVGSFMQHLHVEECQKTTLYRKMYCQRGCRCEQQYRLQKLLVIDPDDECRGIFSDWFRFPSCCVCVCYPATMSSGTNRIARLMDQDEDELDEELLLQDLNDPFVRHYYGLDDESDYAEWSEPEYDLEPQASSSGRVYTSFTDIESIDRSFSESIPEIHPEGDLKVDPPPKGDPRTQDPSDVIASKSKKSRLLEGFNRTMKIRPQLAPRRIPPQRLPSPTYPFAWVRPPLSASFRGLPFIFPHALHAHSFIHSNWATPVPMAKDSATLGTLNAATPPYYRWTTNEPAEKTEQNDISNPVLSRIPRSDTFK